MRRRLLDSREDLGCPAPGQLLQGADVQIAVVEEAFELWHLASEEATILADAVAAHR